MVHKLYLEFRNNNLSLLLIQRYLIKNGGETAQKEQYYRLHNRGNIRGMGIGGLLLRACWSNIVHGIRSDIRRDR